MNPFIPDISVVMPVYNGDKFLNKSIKSVLNQTFENFEFIIINDGSVDESLKIIESFDDRRIKFFNNLENKGITFALNKGLQVAKGKYIARQDQDDISLPNRFKLQLEYMMENNIDLVDTNLTFIDENDQYIQDYEKRYFTPDQTLSHLFFYEMNHSSIMCKSSLFKKYNIRYKNRPTEDYDLFIRLAKAGMKAGRIDKNLIKQRKHSNSMCGSNWDSIKKDIDAMRIELVKDLKIVPTDYEKKLHIAFVEQSTSILNQYNFKQVLGWVNRIVKANKQEKNYNEKHFNEQLYLRLIRLIKMRKRKSILNLYRLKKSAKLYDKDISFRQLLYIYRSTTYA